MLKEMAALSGMRFRICTRETCFFFLATAGTPNVVTGIGNMVPWSAGDYVLVSWHCTGVEPRKGFSLSLTINKDPRKDGPVE